MSGPAIFLWFRLSQADGPDAQLGFDLLSFPLHLEVVTLATSFFLQTVPDLEIRCEKTTNYVSVNKISGCFSAPRFTNALTGPLSCGEFARTDTLL
jgi:hypothetical protein